MVILTSKIKINLANLVRSFSQTDANFEIKSIKIGINQLKKPNFNRLFKRILKI